MADTLFSVGCGRVIEGTPEMMWNSLVKLRKLPDDTQLYCGHEYTQSNGRYALVAEPENEAVAERMRQVDAARAAGEATVPTTISLERATNPFMRARSVAELAERRAAKAAFRG